MTRLIEIVPSGGNWTAGEDDRAQVRESLEALLRQLTRRGLQWSDVGLIWLANSRLLGLGAAAEIELARAQEQFDEALLAELSEFCERYGSWPGLIGASVKASFCYSEGVGEPDIGDGLMWVAVIHRLVSPTVGVELTGPDSPDRGEAGGRALDKAVQSLTGEINARYRLKLDAAQACEGAIGIALTSGSGHVAATAGGVDFRDCYGVGQGLLAAASRLDLTIVGGCASNRAPDQSQCLYYSTPVADDRMHYHVTYGYGAVLALIPAAHVLVQLDHPYKVASEQRLILDFHPHEQYDDSRYFCVRSINGQAPRDFLEQHWTEISPLEFQDMVEFGLPIPAKPKAHYFSIASSQDPNPRSIWPNIPVYFENVNGETLLRLVRAEGTDSFFYLIRMTPEGLVENAEELRDSMELNSTDGDSLVTFLCESRKYVLEDLNSNAEVERLALARPDGGCVIGVYLNGEYSTGRERSIGYHNYSQIGAIFGDVGTPDLLKRISR